WSTEIAEIEQQATKEKHPVTKRVQAGKRHIPRADHQWHEIINQSGDNRDADQKDHRGAVHRKEAIENIGWQYGVVRRDQLDAYHQHHEPGEEEKNQGGTDVHQAEFLVINSDNQVMQTRCEWKR